MSLRVKIIFGGALLLVISCFFVVILSFKQKPIKSIANDDCLSGTISDFPIMGKSTYEDMYKKSEHKTGEGKVYGGIVNHHLFAGAYIAEVIEAMRETNPQTVILISPNHFDHGQAAVQSALLAFDTPLGRVATDCKVLEMIAESNEIGIENNSFYKEHGVLNILPFIAKSLPHAAIVPLIIKEHASYEGLDKLAKVLAKIPNTVVVGSFDFAHDMSPVIEEFKDEKSFDAIKSFDTERIKDISIDSKKGLYLLQKTMAMKDTERFLLFENSNSGYISHMDPNDATSYITGVYEKGDPVPLEVATILIFGDLMLDRQVTRRIEEKGKDYPFSALPNLFIGSDLIVANLEGIFSDNQSVSTTNNQILKFTFDPNLIPILKKYNIDLLSQANNHTNDFGKDGREQSVSLLLNSGIEPFGDPFNLENRVAVKKVGNKRIAFIGYNQFSDTGFDQVLSLVANTKDENDVVIVMSHWGDEYVPTSSDTERKLARRLIDAGADVIAGSHPHIVQNIEIYKNKPIIYSLGNFIFDQDFSRDTTEGMGLGIAFASEGTRLYLIPFAINQSQVQLLASEERGRFLESLSRRSDALLKDQILKGKIILKNEQ